MVLGGNHRFRRRNLYVHISDRDFFGFACSFFRNHVSFLVSVTSMDTVRSQDVFPEYGRNSLDIRGRFGRGLGYETTGVNLTSSPKVWTRKFRFAILISIQNLYGDEAKLNNYWMLKRSAKKIASDAVREYGGWFTSMMDIGEVFRYIEKHSEYHERMNAFIYWSDSTPYGHPMTIDRSMIFILAWMWDLNCWLKYVLRNFLSAI